MKSGLARKVRGGLMVLVVGGSAFQLAGCNLLGGGQVPVLPSTGQTNNLPEECRFYPGPNGTIVSFNCP